MLRRLPKGLLVLLVVLTLVAAACSSDDSGDSGDSGGDTTETTEASGGDSGSEETTTTAGEDSGGGEETVLSLWTFGAMCLDTVIAEWAESNPGVSVEIKEAGYDEHHEALFAALATGEVPDMGAVEVGYSSLFRSAPDQFVDLNTLGAEEIKNDYLPWRWEAGVAADGRVIGIDGWIETSLDHFLERVFTHLGHHFRQHRQRRRRRGRHDRRGGAGADGRRRYPNGAGGIRRRHQAVSAQSAVDPELWPGADPGRPGQ